MAGKKRSQVEDTTGMSKTARASALKKGGKKDEGFHASGDIDRVYSLAGGEYVRILNPSDGKSLHLRVAYGNYFDVVSTLNDKVVEELVRKGFPIRESQLTSYDEHNPCSEIDPGPLGPGEFRPETPTPSNVEETLQEVE